jgi:hypothetical protein
LHTPGGEIVRLAYVRDLAPMSQIDSRLRDVGLPALRGLPGILDVHVARRGPDQNGERIIASVWESTERMAAAMGPTVEEATHADLAPEVIRQGVEILPLAFSLRFPSESVARVLRVFRGEVKDGFVDEYLEAARAGAEADAEHGEGPLGLFLGFAGERNFVTVSVWPDWSTIQSRTGGNTRQPIATRHAQMLVRGTATHYEVLAPAAPPPDSRRRQVAT